MIQNLTVMKMEKVTRSIVNRRYFPGGTFEQNIYRHLRRWSESENGENEKKHRKEETFFLVGHLEIKTADGLKWQVFHL